MRSLPPAGGSEGLFLDCLSDFPPTEASSARRRPKASFLLESSLWTRLFCCQCIHGAIL